MSASPLDRDADGVEHGTDAVVVDVVDRADARIGGSSSGRDPSRCGIHAVPTAERQDPDLPILVGHRIRRHRRHDGWDRFGGHHATTVRSSTLVEQGLRSHGCDRDLGASDRAERARDLLLSSSWTDGVTVDR